MLTFDDYRFDIVTEWPGLRAYTLDDVRQSTADGLTNAVSFWAGLDSGLITWLQSNTHNLYDYQPGNAQAMRNYKSPYYTNINIDAEVGKLGNLANMFANRIMWDGLPEWDGTGGYWAFGLPRHLPSRQSYYAAFKKYYTQTLQPIGKYIGMTRVQRGVTLVATTDYAKSTHYAFDWGVDCQLLERATDDLGDIQTGVSFLRGAARQYNRCWGIDISEFRVAGDGATSFGTSMQLINGSSPSYLRRHMYISYMNGAHAVYMEPVDYYTNGQLNPMGQALKEFGDFAFTRHPDVGKTVVPMAMMLDFSHGFEPKFGYYGQTDNVWNQDLPYQGGDYMTYNFLKTLFPDFRMHGRTPNAPWGELNSVGNRNTKGYTDFLANGGDPRPYEPIATSRWGDQFDVILNNASAATLAKYKIIALVGGIVIDDTLRPILQQWVRDGGILIATSKQVTAGDQSILGVTLMGASRQGSDAQWLPDGTRYTEPAYTYSVITPTSAIVIARNSVGDPLITKNILGAGTVYFAAPDYMQSNDTNTDLGKETTQLLNVGIELLDTVITPNIPVRVRGQPILYTINQAADKTVVLLSNNTGVPWNGQLLFNKPSDSYTIQEWTADLVAPSTSQNGQIAIPVVVPPYDLRIYAMTYPLGTMSSGSAEVRVNASYRPWSPSVWWPIGRFGEVVSPVAIDIARRSRLAAMFARDRARNRLLFPRIVRCYFPLRGCTRRVRTLLTRAA